MMNWIWLGAVVAFGVLEAATAALVSIWFVGGAAVALLASFLGAALWLQIACRYATFSSFSISSNCAIYALCCFRIFMDSIFT